MKKPGYYSSGEFAHMAGVTLRTIRYYDKINILKPALVTDSGARFYTDQDLYKLQQILLFKYLGFSLDEIREMTLEDLDAHFLENALHIQKKLVEDRIEQMQLVSQAIEDTANALSANQTIDWSQMLNLIHLTGMEQSMRHQYEDASNISARISLHSLYSTNPQGWFSWIFEQFQPAITHASQPTLRILEIGCGDGRLWNDNLSLLQAQMTPGLSITLSDISEGMLRDARRNLTSHYTTEQYSHFAFRKFDCQDIPYDDAYFDIVLANHVLFYPEDVNTALSEIHRVLKPAGICIASTYGPAHMQEISTLVKKFDERITLAADNLYDRFGRTNGFTLLAPYFQDIRWISYEDSLEVSDADAIISYILSCHGNQNQYILDRYQEFKTYVKKTCKKRYHITKDAGMFYCIK